MTLILKQEIESPGYCHGFLCIVFFVYDVKRQVRLLEGLYPVYLEDWLRIFRRDQIMVFRNEDYAEDIKGHIEAAFNFLDLGTVSRTIF